MRYIKKIWKRRFNAYLGTNDMRNVEKMIIEGHNKLAENLGMHSFYRYQRTSERWPA